MAYTKLKASKNPTTRYCICNKDLHMPILDFVVCHPSSKVRDDIAKNIFDNFDIIQPRKLFRSFNRGFKNKPLSEKG